MHFVESVIARLWPCYMYIDFNTNSSHTIASLRYIVAGNLASLRYIVKVNFASTIYRYDISFPFTRYRCSDFSLERYYSDISRKSLRFITDLSFRHLPIPAIFRRFIGDKSREQSAIFSDYHLHYFWTIL